MRVVLDTNVLLSGLFTRGICEAVLDACVGSDDCLLVLSEYILGELKRHASQKFRVPTGDVRETVKFLRSHAEMVKPAKVPNNACRDKDDLPVLGTLIAGRGACLVTGDKDLLTLRQFKGLPILSPRQFYDSLK
ncbi:MAG: putative toxin-antitoxin system toxin component, PIN family [Planctomycetota bacterium]|nr:MAG: putative toxin-antitoxin system toxin component, PIN family [Planctomycetota bacterium]